MKSRTQMHARMGSVGDIFFPVRTDKGLSMAENQFFSSGWTRHSSSQSLCQGIPIHKLSRTSKADLAFAKLPLHK